MKINEKLSPKKKIELIQHHCKNKQLFSIEKINKPDAWFGYEELIGKVGYFSKESVEDVIGMYIFVFKEPVYIHVNNVKNTIKFVVFANAEFKKL